MRERPLLDLFLVSWLILFLELACIRWFPAHVIFLSFFTNTVLLACFVGMSVGCLTARQKTNYITSTPLLMAVTLALGLVMDLFAHKLMYYFMPADQTGSGQVVYFGTEVSTVRTGFHVPMELVAALFFGLIAAIMVGPGQVMGRAFNNIANRSSAYSVNLLGSLVGIIAFAAFSYLELPPIVWFGASAIGVAYFAFRPAPSQTEPRPSMVFGLVMLVLALLMTVPTSGLGLGLRATSMETMWSPYYRIDYYPDVQLVDTNRVSHQIMVSRDFPSRAGYARPFLFARDIPAADPKHEKWPEFKRILIIGAGSGNDLSRARQWFPNAEIDAVEIDPTIQRLGQDLHPDKPYASDKVHLTINDGRNFLRQAKAETYDLVIFALIDSLVLHSGYSSIRLENFLFTTECFQEVKRVMKPEGLFVVYNYFRQGWLVARLQDMLKSVFGTKPVILTDPPTDKIELNVPGYDVFTAFYSGSDKVLDPLRRAFNANGNSYWQAIKRHVPTEGENGFRATQPTDDGAPLPEYKDKITADLAPLDNWARLRMAKVQDFTEVPEFKDGIRHATDDWPFLYVKHPTVPDHTLRSIGLTLVMSFVIWMIFGRRPTDNSNSGASASAERRRELGLFVRSFFLGAGFMLVETKAVVHMALLFGSTWMVNTIVFGAVLIMALAGNLLAGAIKPKNLMVFYVGLFAALAAGILIPLNTFLGLDRALQIGGACALVFAPIAFAGVVFAGSFRRTNMPDRMFAANIIGALVGGLAENSSMLLGFQYLLCVAAGFYAFSAFFGNRPEPVAAKEGAV